MSFSIHRPHLKVSISLWKYILLSKSYTKHTSVLSCAGVEFTVSTEIWWLNTRISAQTDTRAHIRRNTRSVVIGRVRCVCVWCISSTRWTMWCSYQPVKFTQNRREGVCHVNKSLYTCVWKLQITHTRTETKGRKRAGQSVKISLRQSQMQDKETGLS